MKCEVVKFKISEMKVQRERSVIILDDTGYILDDTGSKKFSILIYIASVIKISIF